MVYKPAMSYEAIMFDLDGTLADTLEEIAFTANAALADVGAAPLEAEQYRMLVGKGATWLLEQVLGTDDPQRVAKAAERFQYHYEQAGCRLTKPYEGIEPMLDDIAARNLPMAIMSNKPHNATVYTVNTVFPRYTFAAVRGHQPPIGVKPDPTAPLSICKDLAIDPSKWLYVGDTGVDMQTAVNAGFYAVGVLWGFRDEPELRENGAQTIISKPAQLLDLL